MTIHDYYLQKCGEVSDINQHLPTLRDYALRCYNATEFGVRGIVSTWALLDGCKDVVSYDQTHPGNGISLLNELADKEGKSFNFICADVLKITIAPTDMLFIDTFHSYSQLHTELSLHSHMVAKYLIMHDTETFGDTGEDNDSKGLNHAINEFLNHTKIWRLHERFTNNNGLTILKRT